MPISTSDVLSCHCLAVLPGIIAKVAAAAVLAVHGSTRSTAVDGSNPPVTYLFVSTPCMLSFKYESVCGFGGGHNARLFFEFFHTLLLQVSWC
jgi:hypothetical protein